MFLIIECQQSFFFSADSTYAMMNKQLTFDFSFGTFKCVADRVKYTIKDFVNINIAFGTIKTARKYFKTSTNNI